MVPQFNNIEQISITGAYEYNAPAKMYIITDDSYLCERVRLHIIGDFIPARYTAPFSFELIERADSIPDRAVADAVQNEGYLAIIQVIDSDTPSFLVCRKTGNPQMDFMSIINLITASNKSFTDSFPDVVLNYSKDFPSRVKGILLKGISNFAAGVVSAIGAMATPSFAQPTISFGGRKRSGNQKIKVDKEVIEAARKNFADNVLRYQEGDMNALADIEIVLNSLSDQEKNKFLSDYFRNMAAEGVVSFHKRYIDSNNILESSNVSIYVKRFSSCNDNNGFFRVLYKYKDNDLQQFVFNHKESCVLFIMHLLYNKQNGDIRKNLILDNKNQKPFIHIFMKVYDITEAEALGRYAVLQNAYDAESNKLTSQGRLKDYISDCNNAVDKCLLPLDESPFPLTIKRNGFMPILNSKVFFDEDVLKELQTTIV